MAEHDDDREWQDEPDEQYQAAPSGRDPGEVTQLLRAWSSGSSQALEELLPTVYSELRKIAALHLRKERSDHTLQATALVHEVYLRLINQCEVEWNDRAHFFAIAARVMRRVLVDHARRSQAGKRIGAEAKISLDVAPEMLSAQVSPGQAPGHEPGPSIDLLILDQVLTRLAELDERQAKVVELRFFGGLTVQEVAEVLQISEATVAREWRAARVWLFRELRGGGAGGGG